jgi:hypothetical protein
LFGGAKKQAQKRDDATEHFPSIKLNAPLSTGVTVADNSQNA